MLEKLTRTEDRWTLTLLRWTLAIVIFPHGAQKVLGWWGGNGFSASLDFFTSNLGIPAVLAVLVFAAEFLGPLGLALGLLSRLAAAGIGLVMVGAVFMVHAQHGFFMNWYGNQAGEGFEYHLLAIGISLALTLGGSGALSVDRRLAARR